VRYLFIRFFIHPFYLPHTEQKMRTMYYLLMAASEDEVTQKKGMVAIFVNIGKNRVLSFVANSSRKIQALTRSLPFRYSAHHSCVDDTSAATTAVAWIVMMVAGARVRARFRKHEGELREC
jgi:hypothetical protein